MIFRPNEGPHPPAMISGATPILPRLSRLGAPAVESSRQLPIYAATVFGTCTPRHRHNPV